MRRSGIDAALARVVGATLALLERRLTMAGGPQLMETRERGWVIACALPSR